MDQKSYLALYNIRPAKQLHLSKKSPDDFRPERLEMIKQGPDTRDFISQ